MSKGSPAAKTPGTEASKTPGTEGLTALDRDRASSVADEGGVSAATVETQSKEVATPFKAQRRQGTTTKRPPRRP
jgi:general stress protein YciG